MAANSTASAAEGDRPRAARSRRAIGRQGSIASPTAAAGRDVAHVPHEGDRRALLPGRGQRGEDVGDRGEQDDGAEHPHQRIAAAPQRVDAAADEGGQDQRPEDAERLVQAREEPVRSRRPGRSRSERPRTRAAARSARSGIGSSSGPKDVYGIGLPIAIRLRTYQ